MFIISLRIQSVYPSPYQYLSPYCKISCLVWSIDNVHVQLCKEWWWLRLRSLQRSSSKIPFFFLWILSYITKYLGHQIFKTLELIWLNMSILFQTNLTVCLDPNFIYYHIVCCSLSNKVFRNLQKDSRMTGTPLTLDNNSWSLLCLGIWCGG